MTRDTFLAVDVGNTSVSCALFHGGRIVKRARLATADAAKLGMSFFRKRFSSYRPAASVIASVAPAAGKALRRILPRATGARTFLVGRDIQVPVTNLYRRPKQVGADRLLNALAAYERYRRECFILDFGTAITLDIVSAKGEYLGGVIAPGIEITLRALFERTALLPKIERLTHPKRLIGADTVESIQIGCSRGIGGLCDRLVDDIARARRSRPLVIGTGGYAGFMRRYAHRIRQVDPDLTLRGIWLTYAKQPALRKKA